MHNAIVHNLPEQGTVWVTTSVHPKTVVLTVENTGENLTPQLVSTLVEPFLRGTERIRTDHAGVGLGLAIVKSITQAHDGTLTLTPRPRAGSASRCNYPPHHRTLTRWRSRKRPEATSRVQRPTRRDELLFGAGIRLVTNLKRPTGLVWTTLTIAFFPYRK